MVISGGGTGGHIYPAIAIAKALVNLEPKTEETEVIFIGGQGRLEESIVPNYGFKFIPIPVEGFPRNLTWKWIKVGIKVPLGFLKAVSVLKRLNPNVVVGTGGYVSGPVLLAGLVLRKPTLIQEQNAAAGLTNRILSRWVDEVHLGFAEAAKQLKAKRISVTGNPVRAEIARIAQTDKHIARASAGVSNVSEASASETGRLTIFVMGGSLGAHSINVAMCGALEELSEFSHKIQVVHQTGKVDYEEVKAAYQKFSFKAIVQAYFDKIEEIYKISDLMVCRSGGMTLAEITAGGLPAILIPFPFAIGDHQKLNAQAMVERGAAFMIDNSQLDGSSLAKAIKALITDEKKLKEMVAASRELGKPRAAEDIAKAILEMAGAKD